MKTFLIIVIVFSMSVSFANESTLDKKLFKDDFSKSDVKERRAERGDWKMTDGVARCTQDGELYKKYQDHGPIIFYDLPHTNATVKFSFKPEEAKSVVFTSNGEKGHVFRLVISSAGMGIRAFPPEDAAKSISLGLEKVPFKSGEWIAMEVKLEGDTAVIKYGDGPATSYVHPSLSRPKTNLSIGFSFGSLSVKDFELQQ